MDTYKAAMMDRKQIEKALNTDINNGLTKKEAEKRLHIYGKNIIKEEKQKTLVDVIKAQFRNTILWILIIAAIISYVINEIEESIAILAAVVISVVFGTYLEYKADRSIRELSKYLEENVIVIRDGKLNFVSTSQLVPGDVILINAGQKVSADCYIVDATDLEVSEAAFTGESKATRKYVGKIKKPVPLYKLNNILFAGSDVLRGTGKAIVINTGKNTEIGKIAEKLKEIKQETPGLYKDLDKLSENITKAGLLILIVILILGFIKQIDINTLFLFGLTLAVAIVPEGLTTVLTIILGINVKKMADNNALIRKLSAIDNIGRIDIIATDKTGTLTKGKMSLVSVYYNGKFYENIKDQAIREIIEKAFWATESKITDKGIIADEIDKAITEVAISLNLKRKKYDKIIPFSSEKKYMSVTIKDREIIKGAFEVVIKMCTHYKLNNSLLNIDRNVKKAITEIVNKEEEKAKKAIAVAERKDGITTFLGILFFTDPPKEHVKETIKELKEMGIKVIMLTGDNIKTAEAIAREIGIEGKAILWHDIQSLDDKALEEVLNDYTIIARSLPISKLKVVEVLSKKHIVAAVGDGVNDALALKKAHVSVVMGKMGTTVSKEVADIVLLDDNFGTLTKAIKIGKNTIENINNFLRFQLTANVAALTLILLNFIVNPIKMLILTPLQILYINIILDGPPALAQGFETNENIRRKPSILDKNTFKVIALNAFFIAFVIFTIFLFNISDPGKALTYSFTSFVFFQFWNALNCKSISQSFYKKLFDNKVLIITLIFVIALHLFILNNEATLRIFELQRISFNELIMLFAIASSILFVEETRKRLNIFVN